MEEESKNLYTEIEHMNEMISDPAKYKDFYINLTIYRVVVFVYWLRRIFIYN